METDQVWEFQSEHTTISVLKIFRNVTHKICVSLLCPLKSFQKVLSCNVAGHAHGSFFLKTFALNFPCRETSRSTGVLLLCFIFSPSAMRVRCQDNIMIHNKKCSFMHFKKKKKKSSGGQPTASWSVLFHCSASGSDFTSTRGFLFQRIWVIISSGVVYAGPGWAGFTHPF